MQNQRGFVGVGVLIAILVGLAVLGGGAYYATHQQTVPQTTSGNFDNSQTLPTTQQKASQTAQQNPTKDTSISSATIDSSSLTMPASGGTISGTASNINSVSVSIVIAAGAKNTGYATMYGKVVPVTNGRWSLPIPASTFSDSNISYYGSGPYTVEVGMVRTSGEVTTLTKGILTVTSNTSLFAVSPSSGVAPLTVSFTIATTQLSAHKTVSIDFGDGKTTGDCAPVSACLSNPIFHQYATAGTYIAILRGTNRTVLGTATITVSGQTTSAPVNFDPQSVTSFRLSSGQTASDGSVTIRFDSVTPQTTKDYWNITATITENGQPTSYTASYSNYGKTDWKPWEGSAFYKCAKVGCGDFHDTVSPTQHICIAASPVPNKENEAVFTVMRSCEDR